MEFNEIYDEDFRLLTRIKTLDPTAGLTASARKSLGTKLTRMERAANINRPENGRNATENAGDEPTTRREIQVQPQVEDFETRIKELEEKLLNSNQNFRSSGLINAMLMWNIDWTSCKNFNFHFYRILILIFNLFFFPSFSKFRYGLVCNAIWFYSIFYS